MEKYFKPDLKVFFAVDLTEIMGPVQMASGTMNVYGGATTSQLNTHSISEYRVAAADINYGILMQKEVGNA